MSIDVSLIDEATGTNIKTFDYLIQNRPASSDAELFGVVTLSPREALGHFKVAERTSAGTTTVVDVLPDGSIILTDIFIATDKTNSGTVILQFNDDTNTEIIYKGHATDAPVNIAMNLSGRFRGWKNARLEMVTNNSVDASVTVGYIKVRSSIDFAAWDAAR